MGSSTTPTTLRNSADAPIRDLSPLQPLLSPWRHRDLVLRLGRRDIEARYRGSALGLIWAIVQPLVLLAVYTFVFGVVFKMRATKIGMEDAADQVNEASFAMSLFAGLILYNLFSDCVGKAPSILRQNVTFVKKIVFPLEILPWSTMVMAVFNAIVATIVFAIFYAFIEGAPPLTVLLVPVVVLPVIIMVLGLCWILMSVGLYVQDTQQIVGLVLTIALFTCPIFYPLWMVPEPWQNWLYLNPLTVAIEMVREVVFVGTIPDVWIWLIYLGASVVVAWIGWTWFTITRRGFADAV
ncbi:MAG: ABC transporter permease [Planctomycetota bacterium]|nr:ABC transporter permease [Planctomycetota bacterium]